MATTPDHKLPPLTTEQNQALANTSTDELGQLPFLQTRGRQQPTGAAYALAKRANIAGVQAASVQ